MSSVIRVYNIFHEIQSGKKDKEACFDVLKRVFSCKVMELYYLRPFIADEFSACKHEMRRSKNADDIISTLMDYLNHLFIVDSDFVKASSGNISRYGHQKLSSFPEEEFKIIEAITGVLPPLPDKTAEIADIKQQAAELRRILSEDVAKTNDYIYTFILQNLSRIDLLLDNYNKIHPQAVLHPLSGILAPIEFTPGYEATKDAARKMWKTAFNFCTVVDTGYGAIEAVNKIIGSLQ